jgi:hypothetical protein
MFKTGIISKHVYRMSSHFNIAKSKKDCQALLGYCIANKVPDSNTAYRQPGYRKMLRNISESLYRRNDDG